MISITFSGAAGGMEILAKLFGGSRKRIAVEDPCIHFVKKISDLKAIEDNGVEADYVEEYALVKGQHKNRLVLGYGALSMAQIEDGVARLKKALKE